jgi:bacteriocin-like protein
MANIQIADLAQVENQFDELSDLELEAIIGGKGKDTVTITTKTNKDGSTTVTITIK